MNTLLRLMSRRLALVAMLMTFAFQSNSQLLCESNDVLFIVATEMWGNEISWELIDENGIAIALGGDYESNSAYTGNVCLDDGCYTVNMFDSFGDGWNGGIISFILGVDVLGTGSLLEGSEGSFSFGVNTEGCDDNQLVPGCIDESACNFNPDANFDDGSCTYPGCTDPEATNYDADAGCDDDSCEYPEPCELNVVYMVMFDSFGDDWNGASYQIINSDGDVVAEGTHDEFGTTSTDELCLEDGCYIITTGGGSFDSENSYEIHFEGAVLASGSSPDINSFGVNEDGCEAATGCTDADACNFDENALADDGSCTYPGCTDPEALNYDDEAGCDDDSCEYPEPCDQNSVMMNMYDSFGDGWNGASYTITDGDGNVVAEGTLDEGSFEVEALCLADGCYTIMTGGGAFDSENEWELVLGDEVIASGGSPSISGFGLNTDDCEFAFGCTDAEACNYSDTATTDDGSCVYPGCTDPSALNYDANAGCDDGSCELCEDGVVALLYVCTWQNAEEITLEILDDEGNPVIVLDDLPSVQISYFDICLEEGICYTVNMYNTVNDSWYNGYYWINVDGYQVSTGGLEDGETFGQEFFSIDGESCPEYGCTDPEALNYNPDATEDDGSCEYPEPCDYNNVFVNLYDSFGDGWNGAYYSISNEDGIIVGEGTMEQGSEQTHALCLADGCYSIYVEAGAFASEVSWEIMYGGNVLLGGGAPDFGAFGINADCDEPIGGCTDETACNYNADAAWDDGSCTYPGCTDPDALNYDEYAGCDDDSCEYPEPCDQNTVILNMYDSFGDGWNGASYVITDEDGNVVAEGTLDEGTFEAEALCLGDGCYVISTGGGAFDGENEWELIVGDEVIAAGGSPSVTGFGINADDCEVTVGCMDEEACNYNPDATADDGSCTYPGCTDPEALNYDPYAGCDDGSCETCENGVAATLYVCTFSNGEEVELEIVDDEGNVVIYLDELPSVAVMYWDICLEEGICYTVNMYNNVGTSWYGGYYWINLDGVQISTGTLEGDETFGQEFFSIDGESCPVYGCTDPEALNYNPDANEDDGSCEYPEPCDYNDVVINMYDSFGDGWNGATYTIVDSDGNVAGEGTLPSGSEGSDALCLADGCYAITVGGGSFDSEISWDLMHDGNVVANGEAPATVTFGINAECEEPIGGCTDELACNFNADAAWDDGSCTYPGCTDPQALNYDADAGCDDDSCEYPEPCDNNTVIVNLYDSFGDGWNGAYYSISDEDGLIVGEGTMEQGSEETHVLCLADGCYNIYVEAGAFANEVSWEVMYDGNILLSGVAPDFGAFGINAECAEPIGGCTDELACNYNADAAWDDGSCTFPGCTDPEALNYDADAGCDDESCEYPEPCDGNNVMLNMYDSFGDGWNGGYYVITDGDVLIAEGTMETGSEETVVLCLADGCYQIDVEEGQWPDEVSWTISFNGAILASGGAGDSALFGINSDDCEIYGCTDPEALNYNADATADDGSCEYLDDCDANQVQLYLSTSFYAWEISFELLDEEGNVILADGDYDNYGSTSYDLCLEDGCYTFNMYDSYGDGWNGGWYLFTGDNGLFAEGSLFFGDSSFDIISINSECEIDGCMDEEALNYNPAATIDDGGCFYIDDFQITNPEEMLVPVMEVSLAPNPVDMEYKILLNNLDIENALNITIHDLSGRLIYQDIEAVSSTTMTLQMSSAELESGLYILTVVNGNNTSSVTFVRQN